MLAASNEQEIRKFWAAFLGVDEAHLDTRQVVLAPQFFDDEQATIYLLQRGAGVVCSVVAKHPAQALNLAAAAIGERPPAEVFDRDLWYEAFTFRAERIAGPTWVGYADSTTFGFVGGSRARILANEDRPALAAFRQAMPDADWESSGLDLAAAPLYGVFDEDGALASVAGFEMWGRSIAALAVGTLPDRRGKGFGSAALKAVGKHALVDEGILQFRALESDEGAIRIAKSLGFQQWGRTISVRLKPIG